MTFYVLGEIDISARLTIDLGCIAAIFLGQNIKYQSSIGHISGNWSNNIKATDEFEKARQKFNAKFKASEPYLEKALEISPNDKSVLNSLKQLYVRTGETEKYARVKATLDNIK